jgi:hypothetical protein
MLRLPETAATVRCPKCKTLLQVVDEGQPAEPEAPPLPFAGAARPKPAKPAKPAGGKQPYRPQLVDEEAEEAKAAVERKREVRRQLRQMDDENEREEERYEDIKEDCVWGRRALAWLQGGMAAYAVGVLVVFFAVLAFVVFTAMGTTLGAVAAPLALLGMALGSIAMLVLMVGFGLALKGPKMSRHLAVFGLLVTACQVICVAATLGGAIGVVQNIDEQRVDDGWGGATLMYYLLGLSTNLFLVADVPTRISLGYGFPWFGVAAGIFEFARLVFVCQITQNYADLGKNDRASGDAGKGINRVFWVLLLVCMFRFAIGMGFDRLPQQDSGWMVGQVLHGFLFLIAFGFLGFRLLIQIQVLREAKESLLADRVASHATKLDPV